VWGCQLGQPTKPKRGSLRVLDGGWTLLRVLLLHVAMHGSRPTSAHRLVSPSFACWYFWISKTIKKLTRMDVHSVNVASVKVLAANCVANSTQRAVSIFCPLLKIFLIESTLFICIIFPVFVSLECLESLLLRPRVRDLDLHFWGLGWVPSVRAFPLPQSFQCPPEFVFNCLLLSAQESCQSHWQSPRDHVPEGRETPAPFESTQKGRANDSSGFVPPKRLPLLGWLLSSNLAHNLAH